LEEAQQVLNGCAKPSRVIFHAPVIGGDDFDN
jgi:hypothetical protein